MDHGHAKHIHRPEDLTVLKCSCGWSSDELTVTQKRDRGIPWYCDDCGKPGLYFVTFHPTERVRAYAAIGKPLKEAQ